MIAGCSQYILATKEVNKDGGSTLTVMMSGVSYIPSEISVRQGDSIKFVNTDFYAHTVTIPSLDINQEISGDQSITVKVDKAGTFDLQCTIHPPLMTGKIFSIGK